MELKLGDQSIRARFHRERLPQESDMPADMSVIQIDILSLDGLLIQRLTPTENRSAESNWEDVLVFEDLNFDGLDDFRLLSASNVNGNRSYQAWLTQPSKLSTEPFLPLPGFENVVNPNVNRMERSITSTSRDGPVTYEEKHRYVSW